MRAYVPIMRGYLIASAIYYALISLSHPFYETGPAFLILEGLSATACFYGLATWILLGRRAVVGWGLELVALGMNALFLANVAAAGNTGTSGATTLPSNQIITGSYDQRISRLTDCMERIFQSGVAVTLIE